MSDNVSQDFVFGTLATDALRLAQNRAAQSGVGHAYRLEPADPRPGEPATVHVSLGPAVAATHVTCYYTSDGSEPGGSRGVATTGQAIELTRGEASWDTVLWAYLEHWSGTIPGQQEGALVRYRIEAWGEGQGASHWASEIVGQVRGARPENLETYDEPLIVMPGDEPLWPVRRPGGYAYHVDDERVPGWLQDAVIYHVFIDRFAPGEGKSFATPATPGGFYGGTLRGVIEQLDYIAALGASCIWLSPLFPSPSHHGYDATDYGAVEPRLGSEAELLALIAAAHERGMRVLLDYVVNHISNEHPAFQRALARQDAPEAAWFTFMRWPDEYLSFFGVREMPQIDSDSPPARDYMVEQARYWLDRGVDGFRLDYANGPSHAFWSIFRAATRAASPESVTLGEVVETPALQRSYQGRLDGCLDFLLLQALRQFFAFDSMTPSQFDSFLRRHLAFFPADFALPSFLDNHDMNRFLWVVRGDVRRLKLAALCQFTLPHPPIVYYGTEVGLSQVRDVRYPDGSGHPEESRLPMPWDEGQDKDLLSFYRQLIALRRLMGALWRGKRQTLVADDERTLYVYKLEEEPRTQNRESNLGAQADAIKPPSVSSALVALNNGPAPQELALPASLRLGLASDDSVTLDGDRLVLPPFSGAVLLGG
jgi:cyclomaltodextrinase